jgi:hypothetical protein
MPIARMGAPAPRTSRRMPLLFLAPALPGLKFLSQSLQTHDVPPSQLCDQRRALQSTGAGDEIGLKFLGRSEIGQVRGLLMEVEKCDAGSPAASISSAA